jgi:hypothetical protein
MIRHLAETSAYDDAIPKFAILNLNWDTFQLRTACRLAPSCFHILAVLQRRISGDLTTFVGVGHLPLHALQDLDPPLKLSCCWGHQSLYQPFNNIQSLECRFCAKNHFLISDSTPSNRTYFPIGFYSYGSTLSRDDVDGYDETGKFHCNPKDVSDEHESWPPLHFNS